MSVMDKVRVLLFEPQDPLNIGSVVRVCRNTGISDLRVQNPRVLEDARVQVTAPNSAAWIEANLLKTTRWEESVEGTHRLYAFTARAREEKVRRIRLDEMVSEIAALGDDERVALVFGREDHGLPNDVVERCDAFVVLETSEEYRSLNLAQAVLLATHRVFSTVGDAVPISPTKRQGELVSREKLERMMVDVEAALDTLGFFKGSQRDNVLKTLQRVFVRSDLDARELGTFWGIFAEILRRERISESGE